MRPIPRRLIAIQLKLKSPARFQHARVGGRLTKQTLDIVTAEQGSDMRHTGLYFTERDEHLDLFTTDKHEAGHTTGDTVWKGALTGDSRASYEGLIHIVPGAQETDTYLQTHQMLLSPKAKGDAIPSLIVETDNVKASHGGTVGELDQEQIFYMMTRGLSARRGGARARGGVLRGGRAAARGPGSRGARAAPDRREAEGRRGPGARVHRGAGRGRLMGAVADSPLVDLRADFPVLEREINGHPLVYLDSAASAQKPRQVIEAMERFYSHSYGTVHRGVYELGREATELFEGARERIAAFVGWDTDCSIFTRNATEAINLVAYAWGRGNVGPGDEVLITEMEHHSNIVPWQLLCEETGARLRYLSVPEGGELSLDELDAVLAEGRVKLVAVAHVSNVLGTINPVEEIARRARAAGAVTLVDGAQAVPQMPVDLRAIDADFYAWTGHKALGPTVGHAARAARAAEGDAAVPRRRPHDLPRRARALHLERAALEVRGRHQRDRRGDRARRRGGLPVGRDRDGERARARARAHRATRSSACRRSTA